MLGDLDVADGLGDAAQTAAEHAAAAAAVAEGGGPVRTRASRPAELRADTPEGVCPNCATPLAGPVCHVCGQVADEFRRPVRGLAGEIIEGLFAVDGRVLRTIPALILWPGRVTRSFLKGQRARYMPPFRLYIIASLIFFLVAPALDRNWADGFNEGWSNYDLGQEQGEAVIETAETRIEEALAAGEMTEEEAAQAREGFEVLQALIGGQAATPDAEPKTDASLDETVSGPNGVEGENSLLEAQSSPSAGTDPKTVDPVISGTDSDRAPVSVEGDFDLAPFDGSDPDQIRRFFAPEDYGEAAPETVWPLSVRRYLGERFARVSEDPAGWLYAAFDWIPRIMFVMVPVYALLLGLVYVWRRGFFLYDHLIVSLHFHAALFLTMVIAMKASAFIGGGWAFLGMLVYSNAYLYKLNRVVYGRNRFASMVRTLTLDVLYFFMLIIGFMAVLLLGAIAG